MLQSQKNNKCLGSTGPEKPLKVNCKYAYYFLGKRLFLKQCMNKVSNF